MSFETPSDLDKWLDSHRLWVRIFKKNSGFQSVYWTDVVVKVLCWGWIDGVKKSFDIQS